MSAEASAAPSPRALALLALAVFLMHFLVTGGHLQSPDEELMYRTAESIAMRGSTAIQPVEYDFATRTLTVPPEATFATRQGAGGRFYAQYLLLQPTLSVPLIWLANATAGLAAEGFAKVADWPSMPRQYHTGHDLEFWRRGLLAMLFNPIVSAFTAIAIARTGARLSGMPRAGILAALAWATGTIGWAHAKTYFTEPLAGLLGLLAIGRAIRWHAAATPAEALAHARWIGLWCALGVWQRVDFPIMAGGIVAAMAGALLAAWRRDRLASLAVPAVAVGLAFAALQLFNSLRFGEIDATAGYGDQSEGVRFTTPLLVGLHGLLMTPGKGMFFFSPALLLGVAGWWIARHRHGAAAWFAVAGLAPFFVAMALWQNWDGGWCWGPRHIVQVHPVWMVGAAFFFAEAATAARRVFGAVVIAAGAAVQLLGVSQSPLDYYHEYFRTPADGVYRRIAYRDGEIMTVARFVEVRYRTDPREVTPAVMPAPMVGSLYIPQESQWASYPEMWRLGYNDLFWWRAILGAPQTPDRWKP